MHAKIPSNPIVGRRWLLVPAAITSAAAILPAHNVSTPSTTNMGASLIGSTPPALDHGTGGWTG